MSLFDWFKPKKKKKTPKHEIAPVSSGLSRMDSTRPVPRTHSARPAPEPEPGKAANRKHERMARRELLYGVVRECMANAGVVSASYKFKVLSLDARGRQFLVMVDLSREFAGESARLSEIEAMVAQAAKSRYDVVVTAVYWRTHDHVAVGMGAGARPVLNAAPSRPTPLEAKPSPVQALAAQAAAAPIPASHATHPAAASRPVPSPANAAPFDPLHAEEIAAFKAALARGTRPEPVAKHGPHSYALLTGFEDTELPEAEVRSPALSATQYGELR